MFDLNQQISNWRKNVIEKGSCHVSDVDEMESHLKDEIDQLKSQNLSEQEAFLVAAHRLGQPDAIAEEFAKVNGTLWLRKIFYALCGVFAFWAANQIAEAVSKVFLMLATAFGYRGSSLGIATGIFKIAVLIVIIYLGYLIVRSYAGGFQNSLRSTKGKIIIFSAALFLVVLCFTSQLFLTTVFTSMSDAENYGEVQVPLSIINFSWAILLPLILVTFLIYTQPKKTA